MFEKVFVTVGTTSFQPLIKLVVSEKAVDLFKTWKVKEVRIQGGNPSIERDEKTWIEGGIKFELYDYKLSIQEDMIWADLIICHAGAGTTIEALDLKKVLFTVPNDELMDNHQDELAKKLKEENYAFMASLDNFFDEAAQVDPAKLKPFPTANPQALNDFLLEHVFG